MPERRERQQHDPMLLAERQQFPLGEVWMRFDLYHGRFDARRIKDLSHFFQRDVR
jgi:hypothetical protein